MPRFALSPSRIARYHFLECDRYLRFMAVPAERRREEGLPRVESDYSPVTQAVLEGGYAWEQRVIGEHLAGRVVLPPSVDASAPLHDRKLSVEATAAALRTLAPGEAIYQPTLRVPAAFSARFRLDPELVEFRDCYPDLVMCVEGDQGPELRVVDVKASTWLKLSHRIQVGVYTLILSEVLAAEGIDRPLARRGGVWLSGTPAPEWFDLAHILPPIETFLTDDLPRVLAGSTDEAFWHLNFRCEWCEYFGHCRGEAERSASVSLVPYLSSYAKRHLAAAGVDTVDDLARTLAGPGAGAVVAGCASLEGRVPQLRRAVRALETGTALPSGAASLSMPKGEQVRIVLTLQSEPLTGELYGYGIHWVFGKDLYGTPTETIVAVAGTGDPATLAGLRARLVADLMAVLAPVDRHNRATDDWWQQKSVQAYVYDTYERGLLTTVLLQAALEPAVAEDALTLVFWFQRPEIVEAEDHPDTEVFFPVVAPTEVIRATLALPVPISYQLAPVSRALAPSEYGWEYRESDFFSFTLSNRMKSNAAFEVWHRGRADLVEAIERELRHRLWAANSVINGMRARLGPGALVAWPPKFAFPAGTHFCHPLLSRLAFIARYEAVVAYLDIRARRGAPLEERLAAETTLRLTALGGDRFRLDPDQREAAIEGDGWASWILTGDHEAGRRARLSYPDFTYRRANWTPKNLDLALAAVAARESEEVVRLRITPGAAWTPPAAGDVVFLEPRFTDWATEHLLAELAELDADPDPWFVRLLADPVAARTAWEVPGAPRTAALTLAGRHGMNASQQAAFAGVLDHDLQLVWGPPGTGKTHFLALAVLCLVEAHRRAGIPIRVLITAMTNTAIDNCLAKLVELQEAGRVVGGSLTVGKLAGETAAGIDEIDPKWAHRAAGEAPWAVVGATVWQARKTSPEQLCYDLVVIDEGSQLLTGQAAIAVRRVKRGGRLVVAGDDRQLAPIVQADYPAAGEGPPLHRSILEALRAGDPDGVATRALVENFRMNDRLCEYPRRSIYPPEYGPATPEIAARRLRLARRPEGLVGMLTDPAWPLTMCVLEEVRATARNPVEAGLAAEVVVALRELVGVGDDEEFRERSVFVVSPHHAQIRLLRRALEERREWAPMPLVDTVDKVQGQERDAVVVSYGVSDVETALNERQFIYSLNRLNVSITRARSKTVLFLPRPLLEPPIQVLDLDDVAAGVAFMQGLMHWCAGQTAPVEAAVDGGRVTVYRG